MNTNQESTATGFFARMTDEFVSDNPTQKLAEHAEETIEVCPYCGTERGDRFSCCGEVHFVTVSRTAWENGEEIL